MKNIVRLTEKDLTKLVKRVINEAKDESEDDEKMQMKKEVKDIKKMLDTIVDKGHNDRKVHNLIADIEEKLLKMLATM